MVDSGLYCHHRGNIAPIPYRIDYRQPPPSFLTFRRFRGGDSPATSASSCICRPQRGRGVVGVRYRGTEGGVGVKFGGCIGGVETLNPLHVSFLP